MPFLLLALLSVREVESEHFSEHKKLNFSKLPLVQEVSSALGLGKKPSAFPPPVLVQELTYNSYMFIFEPRLILVKKQF